MGLEISGHINVEDTGARHKGKSGYCTHIGNELFAWFQSTDRKSRVNFLKLLCGERPEYVINAHALDYMSAQKLPRFQLERVGGCGKSVFEDESKWKAALESVGLTSELHIRIATEGALLGSIVRNGLINRELEARFDEIFGTTTCYQSLNLALKRIRNNKSELLLVLDRPDIPLHNNTSERDIREYVKKRKISGSTRSDLGRCCRDTFTSLKKTCRKLKVSFWEYIKDRVSGRNTIEPLADLMRWQVRQSPG